MTRHVKYEESISAYKPEWQDEIRPYCDKKSFYTFNQPVNLIKINNHESASAWRMAAAFNKHSSHSLSGSL